MSNSFWKCYIILVFSKGQLISKRPFGIIVWTKIPTKLFLDFCPEIFCNFLGASWKLFWASCLLPYSWYYLLSPKEAQKASRKPPESYTKFQGRNPEIISLLYWEKLIFRRDIIKLTDLYKGQLISKCPFDVFNSSKRPTIFFQDICTSLKKEVK